MEALIEAFSTAKSPDEIEIVLSSSSALNLAVDGVDFDKSGKEALIAALTEVLNNDGIDTTAKLRRRIKRFQQSLETGAAATHDVLKQRNSSTANPSSEKEFVTLLSPSDSVAALSACKTHYDLERVMNNLYLPREDEGGVNAEFFAEFRCPMKDILKDLLSNVLTNKALRRRLTRLVFVLSTDVEQAEEIVATKAKAAIAAVRNLTAKKVKTVPAKVEIESVIPIPVIVNVLSKFEAAKCISACISGLRAAKTPVDVENVISALPASGFGDSETLRDLLNEISENSELVNNAKLRRRVKRLIETLASSAAAAAVIEPTVERVVVPDLRKIERIENAISSSSTIKAVAAAPVVRMKIQAVPLCIPSVVVTPPLPPVRVVTGSFVDSFKLLVKVSTSSDVEMAINDLSTESEGNSEAREAVRNELEQLIKNEDLVNTSKLRRRVKRLIDVLSPVTNGAETEFGDNNDTETDKGQESLPLQAVKPKKIKKPKAVKVDTKNPPAGPPLENVISQVGSVKTLDDLSSILESVTEQSGSCSSRRTLKRALERVMKGDGSMPNEMSAQTRRKLRRTMDMLVPSKRLSAAETENKTLTDEIENNTNKLSI